MADEKVYYMNKGTRIVGEAEKEASEVLHSLLSVERVENPESLKNIQHQVVVLSSNGEEIQWHESGLQHHGNVFMLDNSHQYSQQGNTVLWDNTLELEVDSTTHPDQMVVPAIIVNDETYEQENPQRSVTKVQETKKKTSKKVNQKAQFKKPTGKLVKRVLSSLLEVVTNEVDVETDSADDVRQRFQQGCECQDVSCFYGLNPDSVYRLNIAELTKEEHDMYLMGVTMACMSDPSKTVKHRDRRRLRAQYVYHGRRVCLSAFLYLENCTLYQLKRIRKHVMTHGVTPRVHGNHGKKPHNVFSLETYRRATDFLKLYIDQHNSTSGNCKNTFIFPPEISRKTIHNAYKEHMMNTAPPDEKTMGYSTFRHFMKEQFPHVRFCKVELGSQNSNNFSNSLSKQQHHPSNNNHTSNHVVSNTHRATNTEESHTHTHTMVVASQAATAPIQTLSTIPLLIQEQSKPELTQTYIVTPVSQLLPAGHTIAVAPLTNYTFTM